MARAGRIVILPGALGQPVVVRDGRSCRRDRVRLTAPRPRVTADGPRPAQCAAGVADHPPVTPLHPSAAPPATGDSTDRPLHALVVEDDPDINHLVCFKLERAGFSTEARGTGPAGLEAALARPPDVVVLDLMLPGLTGYEVCAAIRQDPRTAAVPVVLLTARAQQRDIERGFAAGADDYITKPFSPAELLSRVRAACDRGHRAR